jgi:hypothetical protein
MSWGHGTYVVVIVVVLIVAVKGVSAQVRVLAATVFFRSLCKLASLFPMLLLIMPPGLSLIFRRVSRDWNPV